MHKNSKQMVQQTKQIKPSTIMWTKESTLKAFRAKRELTQEEVKSGVRKLFTVKGNGTIVDVMTSGGDYVMSADGSGELLRKKIFNTDYLSPSGLNSPNAKEYLAEAVSHEVVGNKQEAANYYNAFLNAVSLTFSVLSNSKLFNGGIANGDQIAGNLQAIETPNGTLVTIDPKSITVKQVVANPTTSIDPFARLIGMTDFTEQSGPSSLMIPSAEVEEFKASVPNSPELVTP
jgi:hypothetical protein